MEKAKEMKKLMSRIDFNGGKESKNSLFLGPKL